MNFNYKDCTCLNKIHQINRKKIVASFMLYLTEPTANSMLVFVLRQENTSYKKTLALRGFKPKWPWVPLKNDTSDFSNPSVYEIDIFCDNHWIFWTFSMFQLWNKFSVKQKQFSKNCTPVFQLKVLLLKAQHFHTKLTSQKSMSRQIKQRVQNGPITKNTDLPLTVKFFFEHLISV